MNDETLNAIFYNPDHTKRYNPSGKPTGVVLTDFDIMEAKQAIEDLYTEKLEAFAEEVMEETPNRKLGTIKMPLNNIEIGYNLAIQDVRKSLKAIKERWIK